MFCRLTDIFKLCLNKKWSLRKQMMVSFLSVSGAVLVLALAAVLATTFIIGNKAETEARRSLEDQIQRHLTDASIEAAATIGERFRRIQYAVLDVTAFALRDALREDLILDSDKEGYPLSPAHTDLRETEVSGTTADLEYFYRAGTDVDLGRSVWYYSDGSSATAEVDDTDNVIISNSARLDLLWPTMYLNSNDTDSIYVAVPFENTSGSLFRMFPGRALSAKEGTLFACSDPEEDGCYDPTVRPWYQAAVSEDEVDESTGLGPAVITDPYIDASETDTSWLVTLARAVYDDDGETLLGVVGVDVRLEQVQLSVEGINFLITGYSILATAEEGNVVAAPDAIWDRDIEEETDTLCNLESSICSGESGWEDLIAATLDEVYEFTDDGGEGQKYKIVSAPVQATFDLESGDGTITHYILSAVPEAEILEPVEDMEDMIRASTVEIMVTTGIVALATLAAVAVAVCVVAGNITRPIKKMTDAARSIAKDGAKTNVFGGVAADWGIGKDGESSARGSTSPRRIHTMDYLLCRGEDEIDTLVHEFSLMITGLGRRGKASRATGLEETMVYPKNPFTTSFQRTSIEISKDDS